MLSSEGAPGLSERQIWAVALASAIASRNVRFTRALEAAARDVLSAAYLQAARTAAAIMGMNNIYYRFLHLVEDGEYQRMPARLRMNVLAHPGIDTLDFELLSLAVSAINGCGLCISSHAKKLHRPWRDARGDAERGAHRGHGACSRGGIRVLGRPGRAPGAGGPGPLKARPGSHSERLTPRGSARHTSKHASARPNLPLVVALLRTRSGRWTLLHS